MKYKRQTQQVYRDRKRERGFVLKHIWVKPSSWPLIQRYLKRFK